MLSTTTEYALRIMVVLAESDGAPMTSERIALLTEVPTDYSVKVLQMLARAGFVRAQRGRGGGFHIACDPDVTSLLDIVSAIDSVERIEHCPIGSDPERLRLCALHQALDDAIRLVRDRLGAITLSALVASADGSALCQPTPSAPAVSGAF